MEREDFAQKPQSEAPPAAAGQAQAAQRVTQPDLFDKRKRRRAADVGPGEFEICCTLATLCRKWLSEGWKFTHLPMGEMRDRQIDEHGRAYSPTGQRLLRMGTSPGWPDYMFVGPDQRVIWLEMKRRSGKLNESQRQVRAHLLGCGFLVAVCHSLDEAVNFLQCHGVLLRSIKVQ